jgi:hypothetical protein
MRSLTGEYLDQARNQLSKAGYPNASGASIETLARYMIRGDVACLDVARRRYIDGELHHGLRDPLFRSVGGSADEGGVSPRSAQSKCITVDQAVERFRDDPQRAGLSVKNINGYEPGFKLLREVVGGNAPLALSHETTRARYRRC